MSGDERHEGRTSPTARALTAGASTSTVANIPPQRLVTRVVVQFLISLTAAAAKAHDGDVRTMVVFMAIQHANIEYMETDPELASLYFGSFPPDTLRRPISVHAMSHSLSLAPETARRHVKRLIDLGYCARASGRGVIVPSRVMTREPFATSMRLFHDAFIRMLIDFKEIGFDPLAAAGGGRIEPERQARRPLASPRHAVAVVVTGYFMRIILDGVGLHGRDFIRGLLFVTVMSMNVDHITLDPEQAWRFADAASVPPDALRRPVTVQAVAARLGVPYETARQHLMRMVASGEIVKVAGGLITPASALQHPDRLRSGLNIYVWLLRAIAQLDRLGFDFDAAVATVERGEVSPI